MATIISRFAIGVVAAAARVNEKISPPGDEPAQGIRLTLDHAQWFHIILITSGVTQLLFVVVASILCRQIKISQELLRVHGDEIQQDLGCFESV
jgi:hypothetical protein